MKRTVAKVLMLASTLLIIGCGDKAGPAGKPKKADTPKQALENMRLALLTGDEKAFVNCFEASQAQKQMLGSMCEFSSAAGEFQKAMEKAYGEGSFKQNKVPNPGADLQDENWLEDVTIKVDGDRAEVLRQGIPQGLKLIRKDGLWKIDSWSMLGAQDSPDDKDMDQAAKMFQAMTKAIEQVRPKIGQAGYTAEKLDQELKQAMMMAMMQAAGAAD